MKKIIAAALIIACMVTLFAGCGGGRIGKADDEADTNTVVTEDPTKIRTKYGNIESSTVSFIYEVINPYEKNADGTDVIATSYEIYTDKAALEEALREKALVFMNEYGNIIVSKYTDLSGGKWVCYINGEATKRDITKLAIEQGATYTFKFVKD